MADECEPDLGPIKGTKRKGNGKTQRHCFTCNTIVRDGEFVLYEVDEDGDRGDRVTAKLSLNKNKAWELLDQDNIQVVNHTRKGGNKKKAAGSKEWKGVGDSETQDKDMSQQGRQAKKLARQQKAKNAKSVEHRTTGGKVTVAKGFDVSSSSEEESSSEASESGSEEKEPIYEMELESATISKKDRAYILCKQCHGGGSYKSPDKDRRKKEAQEAWKDQI